MDNISLNSFQNDVTEKVVEKVKTQFYVQKHVFFSPENRVVLRDTSKDIVEFERPHMTI